METWFYASLGWAGHSALCDWSEIVVPVQVEPTRTRLVIHLPDGTVSVRSKKNPCCVFRTEAEAKKAALDTLRAQIHNVGKLLARYEAALKQLEPLV